MGKSSKSKTKKRYSDESESESEPSPSPSPSESSDDQRLSSKSRHRRRRRRDEISDGSDGDVRRSSTVKEKSRSRSSSSRRRKDDRKRSRDRDRGDKRRSKHRKSTKLRGSGDDDDDSDRCSSDDDEFSEAIDVARVLLKEFPGVADDLKQLLQMIDDGQAVDIKGISEKALMKHLKKLFLSLDLKEKGDRVFLLRSKARPTLEVIGPIISTQTGAVEEKIGDDGNVEEATEDVPSVTIGPADETTAPRRRVIGPEMPSAELLAAAAKLTDAEAKLREAELDLDDGEFVGPPPPALVTEAASTNEAERFEEVTRIMGADANSPYDIVGVNHKMVAENLKKRYWKLSLMVHPDKCPHPQAHQAFIKLNKAFKDLQDPDKRKALDDSIKKKEEEEEMKVELRSMREAALWRRSQGLSMEGDDVLLAELEVKLPPKRDEWMTDLPPERKPGGMPMHSTTFSRNAKEGRGDTSAWTDTPSARAQKAKMNYLEAYNQATALASNEVMSKISSADAALVDEYNKAKRSKSLVQKHKEEIHKSHPTKKSKKGKHQPEDRDWEGNHPWKPWDREKDLTAGRQNVKLDPENLTQGLTSRFSSSSFQRSFL
ncbi:uncharacterized protein LOC141604894 [Silene latifolia]|uniref:uncharacterized protein LOC141604894 n=1 Tax=Silene latifolia TaxID=37657 RepID=UPI003D77E5D8